MDDTDDCDDQNRLDRSEVHLDDLGDRQNCPRSYGNHSKTVESIGTIKPIPAFVIFPRIRFTRRASSLLVNYTFRTLGAAICSIARPKKIGLKVADDKLYFVFQPHST